MNCRVLLLLMGCFVASTACGIGDPAEDPLDPCVADRVTVEHGVYGQLLNGCDTEDCTASYAVGLEVRIYDGDPTPADGPQDQGSYDGGTDLVPIARTTSSDRGFYEVALEPGSYFLCTNSCTELTVPEAPGVTRIDWASGPGGGNWWVAECPET